VVGLRARLDGCGKSSLPAGFDSRIVHTVANIYTELLTYNNDDDGDNNDNNDNNNNSNYIKQPCWVTALVFCEECKNTKHSAGEVAFHVP
jgi:hypothetical protein